MNPFKNYRMVFCLFSIICCIEEPLEAAPLTTKQMEKVREICETHFKGISKGRSFLEEVVPSHTRKSRRKEAPVKDWFLEEFFKEDPDSLEFETYFCQIPQATKAHGGSSSMEPKLGAVSLLQDIFHYLLLRPNASAHLKALARAKYVTMSPQRNTLVYAYYVFGNFAQYAEWKKTLPPKGRLHKDLTIFNIFHETRKPQSEAHSKSSERSSKASFSEPVALEASEEGARDGIPAAPKIAFHFDFFENADKVAYSIRKVFNDYARRWFCTEINTLSEQKRKLAITTAPYFLQEEMERLFQAIMENALFTGNMKDVEIFCTLPIGHLHRPTAEKIAEAIVSGLKKEQAPHIGTVLGFFKRPDSSTDLNPFRLLSFTYSLWESSYQRSIMGSSLDLFQEGPASVSRHEEKIKARMSTRSVRFAMPKTSTEKSPAPKLKEEKGPFLKVEELPAIIQSEILNHLNRSQGSSLPTYAQSALLWSEGKLSSIDSLLEETKGIFKDLGSRLDLTNAPVSFTKKEAQKRFLTYWEEAPREEKYHFVLMVAFLEMKLSLSPSVDENFYFPFVRDAFFSQEERFSQSSVVFAFRNIPPFKDMCRISLAFEELQFELEEWQEWLGKEPTASLQAFFEKHLGPRHSSSPLVRTQWREIEGAKPEEMVGLIRPIAYQAMFGMDFMYMSHPLVQGLFSKYLEGPENRFLRAAKQPFSKVAPSQPKEIFSSEKLAEGMMAAEDPEEDEYMEVPSENDSNSEEEED